MKTSDEIASELWKLESTLGVKGAEHFADKPWYSKEEILHALDNNVTRKQILNALEITRSVDTKAERGVDTKAERGDDK